MELRIPGKVWHSEYPAQGVVFSARILYISQSYTYDMTSDYSDEDHQLRSHLDQFIIGSANYREPLLVCNVVSQVKIPVFIRS